MGHLRQASSDDFFCKGQPYYSFLRNDILFGLLKVYKKYYIVLYSYIRLIFCKCVNQI